MGEYRLHLHTALVLRPSPGELDDLLSPDIPRSIHDDGPVVVLHATAIAAGTCARDVKTFARYYRPVAAEALSTWR